MNAADVSKFLQTYAKRHSAGAFATPTTKELQAGSLDVVDVVDDAGRRVVAVVKTLRAPSDRRDFTGRTIHLPRGAVIVTHVAADPDATLPDLGFADVVFAYQEDRNVTDQLERQGRELRAVNVTAASEIVGAWGGPGDRHVYPPEDAVTVAVMPVTVPPDMRSALADEVDAVDQWHDDYPYYNVDGSWSSVSLRGFDPSDPTWGVKPSEMGKAWWRDHPDAATMRCDWTVLADRTPALVDFIESVPWWGRMERVRLLRMEPRPKGAKLLRHSDITDRAAGVGDGQIARFHVPLVTHRDVTMQVWELDGSTRHVHLDPWRCFYLDQRKPHAVSNPTTVTRVHLVVDVVCDQSVRDLLVAARPI